MRYLGVTGDVSGVKGLTTVTQVNPGIEMNLTFLWTKLAKSSKVTQLLELIYNLKLFLRNLYFQ